MLQSDRKFSLTARIDLEDRSFHEETNLNPEGESYFRERLKREEGLCFRIDIASRITRECESRVFSPRRRTHF